MGKYVRDRGLTDRTVLTVETLGGIKTLWLTLSGGAVSTVRVCMGAPEFRAAAIPVASEDETFLCREIEVCGESWEISAVNTGNPHGVVFVEDPYALDFDCIGPAFEHHAVFPERANIEFIHVIDAHTIRMRVWERGSGETLACGTGACASTAVAARLGKAADSVDVLLTGGTLHVEWDRAENLLYMTGPAAFVFDGEVTL